MDSQNQVEQPQEDFFYEEDSQDGTEQPIDDETSNDEVTENYKELQKKFTKTAQEKAKLAKEAEELRKKAEKAEEYERKEQEEAQKKELQEFKNTFSGLTESSIKAIADLKKTSDKSLEEIAAEYGFIEEVEKSVANSKSVRGRNFALPNTKKETYEIPRDVARGRGWKTAEEVDEIRAKFGI